MMMAQNMEEMELIGLESREVQELEKKNQLLEQNLEKAAEMGKMLLEENESLKYKIEELGKGNERKLELIHQEKYEVQLKLDQKMSMEGWYIEEIANLRQMMSEGQDSLRQKLETERNSEVLKLTRQIEELRAELEHKQSLELHLKQKNDELEELLQEKINPAEITASKSFSNSEELNLLQEEIATLQVQNTNLKSQLIDKKLELDSLHSEYDIMRGKLICRDEELDDIRCQFTSVNNALENLRMEKLELNCQLDALRLEASTHNKKGNSIFSEVEDRRVEAEKKLISLKVKCESLKEKYNVEKQQNHKYKRQISQLLMQLCSGKADTEYVEDLKTQLSQARQKLREQMEENIQEKQEVCMKKMPEFFKGDESVDQEYITYLKTLISGKEKEIQKVKEELKIKNIQLLDEQSRTTMLNTTLQQLEAEKNKLRSQNIQFSMKLDQLRMKYEPESLNRPGTLVVKKREKIPVNVSEVQILEASQLHGNISTNQSQTSIHPEEKIQTQALTENQTENIQNGLTMKKKSKTVSISDEVDEHEYEKTHQEEESRTENLDNLNNRPKGRRQTKIKHISGIEEQSSKNDCKSQ